MARARYVCIGSLPPATSTMTWMSGSSSRSPASVVISSREISTVRGFSASRTSTRFRDSSTPARRDSCCCQVSIRSATRAPTVPSPISPTFKAACAMGAILPAVTRILREADVARVIEMDAVMAAVTAAMRELGEGTAQNEPRRRAFAPGAILNVMFAAFPGGGFMGVKAYSVSGGSARFLVNLFAVDGTLQAVIEAHEMGAFRTGAASGVAARALAGPGPETGALVGTRGQAKGRAAGPSPAPQKPEAGGLIP